MPERETVAAAARLLLVRVRAPVWAPAVEGAKATPTVQLAPGSSDCPQVLVPSMNPDETTSFKSPSAIVSPEFVIVTVSGLLVVPTPVVGKVSKPGSICTAPVKPPIPLSVTVAGVGKFVELAVSRPLNDPREVGKKTTPVVQLAPPRRVAPQVFCVRLNGPDTVIARPFAAVGLALAMITV